MASTNADIKNATAAPSHADRQTDALATAQRERDDAVEAAARATLAANVLTAAVENDIRDSKDRARVADLVQSERDRALRTRQPFDYRAALGRALQAVKPTAIAPVSSKGEPIHPGGPTAPRTFQEVTLERERRRQRLRELGLQDPATQSIPGDGGGLTGGPAR